MKLINIVLPVFREEGTIEVFNKTLLNEVSKLAGKYRFKIIYVLDKSPDKTAEQIRKICDQDSRVQLVALSSRFGYQYSIAAGLDFCDGDAVIIMDADLEHPPTLIPKMLEKFDEGFDVVNTVRTYHTEISFFKKQTSRLFYRFLQSISNVSITADSDEFKLLSRQVVTVFQKKIREQNLFLRGLIQWVGFNQTSIQFVSGERAGGASKFNLTRLVQLAFHGVLSFSKLPLQFAVYVGMFISLLSFAYGFFLIALRLTSSATTPPGWTEAIVITLFVGGLQLTFLGIIGQYIGGIFDEVKNRPRYVVEQVYTKD